MTLARLHSLTIDDDEEDNDGSTSRVVSADLLEELDDFLQWVKDPSDNGVKAYYPIYKSDAALAGDTKSPLGASKNTLQTVETLEEITLLRDMDIADHSFFGGNPPKTTPPTTTMFASIRPHLRITSATEFSAHISSPESSSSSAAVTPISEDKGRSQVGVVKKKRDQNRSRRRQREELLQLRVVVKELEARLKELLYPIGSSNGDCTTSSPTDPDELAPLSSSLLASQRRSFLHKALFWKRAASTAKQQAEFAQMENARLRALIEEHEIVCDGAREIWHSHPATSLAYGDANEAVALSNAPICDFAPFEILCAGLDALIQRQCEVWAECGFQNNLILEWKPKCQLRVDGDSAFVEMTRSSALPFAPEEVNRALWEIVKRGLATLNMGELKIHDTVENMVFLTLSDTIRLPEKQNVTIKAWIVVKQLVENDQIVSVWQSTVEIQSGLVPTFELSESGWDVVQCLTTAGMPCSLKRAPSILQSCVRSTPKRNGVELARDELSADSLVTRVITQLHRNRMSLLQVVENRLLDESLAGRKVEKEETVSL